MIGKTTAAAAAGVLLALGTLGGCPRHQPVFTFKVGDGHYDVTADRLATGTWETANAGPHTDAVQCEWYVSKSSSQGRVQVRSHNPGSTIQRVYLGPGDVFDTHACGTWVRISPKNLT